MKMRIIAALPLFALTSFAVAKEDEGHWKINANIGLTFVSSTTSSQTFNFLADATTANKGVDSLRFDGGFFENRQEPVGGGSLATTANYFFVGGRYERNASKKMSYYVSTRFRRDNPNDLDLRSQYGAGLAYAIHDGKKWGWTLSAGASYLTETYVSGASSKKNTGVEFGSRYRRTVSDKIDVSHTLAYIPKVISFDDYILSSVFQLGYSLNDTMKLTISDVLDFNSRPSAGALRQNTTLFIGLGIATKL